jgi:hypothetical protein
VASRRIVITLSLVSAAVAVAYWAAVFTGLFPVGELVPGYRD